MRALLAFVLVVLLAGAATAPHLHADARGGEECPACVASGRVAEAVVAGPSDLSPRGRFAEDRAPPAFLPLGGGAPLGAIPGQSPPRA